MEPVDRKTVLLAKVVIFTEQSRAGDMEGGLAEDKASVAVGLNKNNGQRETAEAFRKGRKIMKFNTHTNEKGESHEGRFCSSEK
jgi:hypothetical protein